MCSCLSSTACLSSWQAGAMWKVYSEPPFNPGVWPLSAHARTWRSVFFLSESYQSSGANLSFLMTTGNHAVPSCKVLTVQRAAGALTNLEYGLRLNVPSNNNTTNMKKEVGSKPTHSMINLGLVSRSSRICAGIQSNPCVLPHRPQQVAGVYANKENISHKSALSNLRSFFTNPAGARA